MTICFRIQKNQSFSYGKNHVSIHCSCPESLDRLTTRLDVYYSYENTNCTQESEFYEGGEEVSYCIEAGEYKGFVAVYKRERDILKAILNVEGAILNSDRTIDEVRLLVKLLTDDEFEQVVSDCVK